MLGPMRSIGDVYFENQMIFNSIIVGGACLKIMNKRSSGSEPVDDTENM